MLKENWRLISRFERCGDTLLIVGCFFLAYYGRSSLVFWDDYLEVGLPFRGDELAPLRQYALVLGTALVTYLGSLHWLNAYSSMRYSSAWRLVRVAFTSSLLVFLSISSALFLFKLDFSRSFVILFCLLVALSLAAERIVVLELLRYWRRKGLNYRNVIICGIGAQAFSLAKKISLREELGIRVRAFADLRGTDTPALQEERREFRGRVKEETQLRFAPLVVGVGSVSRALKDYAIDEVIFADVNRVMPEVEEIMHLASEQGVRTTMVADVFRLGMVTSELSFFEEIPLIHFQTPPGDRWELSMKRLFDVAVSALLLLLFSPVFIVLSLAIKLTSPGPVFFVQRRIGLNGRPFKLYKFRSMFAGAEDGLKELQACNEMRGPVFKMRDDPRITPIGKVLRRYSLDELPQLWNVFRGEMSLVGPRPPIPNEVSLYERKCRRRLSMRPGMTCIWQVSGRNEISDFDSWVRLDLEYIDNWSFGRDLYLLWRTIPAVLFGHGAR